MTVYVVREYDDEDDNHYYDAVKNGTPAERTE